jgi:nitroreductase
LPEIPQLEALHVTLSAVETHDLKKAPHVDGLIPVLLERWSARSFAEREVSLETLKKVFEAARWAASSSNEQPWRFLVGRGGDEAWEKIFQSLAPGNKKWAHKAPVLILGVANTRFVKDGSENRFALYDLGAAASYLTLQSAALGLTAHQMAGFDREAARQAFAIPPEYALGAAIALGYRDEPAALGDEGLIARETSPRSRKPLREFVFSAWGQPAEL